MWWSAITQNLHIVHVAVLQMLRPCFLPQLNRIFHLWDLHKDKEGSWQIVEHLVGLLKLMSNPVENRVRGVHPML